MHNQIYGRPKMHILDKRRYGETLLKTGQKEEAVKMYKKSIDLNPNNANGKKILEEISR